MGFRLIGLYDTIKHVAVFLHAIETISHQPNGLKNNKVIEL
ncbi:hypothetical protein ACQJ9B_01100 [Helicobacter pylori]